MYHVARRIAKLSVVVGQISRGPRRSMPGPPAKTLGATGFAVLYGPPHSNTLVGPQSQLSCAGLVGIHDETSLTLSS